MWVEQANHSSQIAMASALITIQKIMTAPLIAFALMSPMPEGSKSEKLWRDSSGSVNSRLSQHSARDTVHPYSGFGAYGG